ncbi:MAG: outer membrane lipoprotein LolB [Methyloprofundus sp.]|nr:outer membrane lipoprotein LolB [Methyloprofundus sp.]
MVRKACLVICIAALAACSTVEVYDASVGRELSNQQALDLEEWYFHGRVLIKSDELLTANIQWQHTREEEQGRFAERDDINLFGALGLGAVKIALNEQEISLDTGSGEVLRSEDKDAFIAQHVGFVVPITALRRWVIGTYLQDVPVQVFTDGFEQLGWRVSYTEYMQAPTGVMPRKIKISKGHIKLKLIIDQWGVENE